MRATPVYFIALISGVHIRPPLGMIQTSAQRHQVFGGEFFTARSEWGISYVGRHWRFGRTGPQGAGTNQYVVRMEDGAMVKPSGREAGSLQAQDKKEGGKLKVPSFHSPLPLQHSKQSSITDPSNGRPSASHYPQPQRKVCPGKLDLKRRAKTGTN